MSQPLTSPNTSERPTASAQALASPMPFCIIWSSKPEGTASAAIIEMSMPRPITTTDMPSPRMPRMATFCSNVSKLSTCAKPGSSSAKPANISTNRTKTMLCWEIWIFFIGVFVESGHCHMQRVP